MLRKVVFLFLAAALLLGGFVKPSSSAYAARPEPPAVDGIQPPEIDFANVPETIQKATQFKDSQSAEQLAAGRAILDKYLPELQAISESMIAQGKPERNTDVRMDPAIAERINKLVADIEAEMAGILSAEQLALFQAATRPEMLAAETSSASPQGVDGYYTSYCFYAAWEDSWGWYYAYWQYLYAYYEYAYYYTNSYDYYAYYYSYYGYLNAGYGIQRSGPLYFQAYYPGMWWSNYPYYSYYYNYYADYYSYYGYLYAYYSYYYYSGSSYAYYSYYYGYYANYYLDWARYDAYWCYYYLSL